MAQHITTERLVLRPFHAGDAGWVCDAMQVHDVASMMPMFPHPYRLEDASTFVSEIAPAEARTFAIELNGKPVGSVSSQGQLGYWLCRGAWGHGVATEASRAVIDLRFAEDETSVVSSHRPGNAASRNVLTKLGFVDTDLRQITHHGEGRGVDMQYMELTADAWRARA